jgi:hypothetical protein
MIPKEIATPGRGVRRRVLTFRRAVQKLTASRSPVSWGRTMRIAFLVAAVILLVAAHSAAAKRRAAGKKPPPPPTGFPTSCEIDKFLDDTLAMAPKERLDAAVAMIARMQNAPVPRDQDPFPLWEYFLHRWANRFLARGEMDVLEAVDAAPPDARFSSVCPLFYRTVLEDRRAIEHYRFQSNRGRMAVCFSSDELGKLIALPKEGGRDMPFYLTRVTACEADEFVAGIGQGTLRARRVELLLRQAYGEQGDPAGASYLLARLAARFRAHPDEAILGGFDAAVRDTPPEKRSCELYWSSIKSKASCAVYRQHYQKVTAIPPRCVTEPVIRCLEQ